SAMPVSKSPTTAWSSRCDGSNIVGSKIRHSERSEESLFRWCRPSHAMTQEKHLLAEDEFIGGFHAIGEERYHPKDPFHQLMHEGALTRGQLQAWALNRYYYQSNIPRKDAALLARTDDHTFRTAWRKRLVDHDGDGAHSGPGGIEKWLKLVEATGLP